MTDYSKTKIYIIRSPNTDKVYIGATVQRLSGRFSAHTSRFRKGTNKTKAVEVLKHGGAYIELLESFPCDNIDESNAREKYWVREFEEHKVNKYIPGRTPAEYHRDNRERRNERGRQYHQDNKQKRNERCRQYHQNNRERIKERQSKKFECPCGGRYIRNGRARHFRTFKHRMYYFNEHNIFNHL